MDLGDLLRPDAVLPALRAQTKRQALEEVCRRAAELIGADERDVFDIILKRERLGSTGVGHGVAIPHGRLKSLSHLTGVFARLTKPIDFEAIDDEPVDLIFLLVAPDAAGADHLKALARIARVLRDPHVSTRLREAQDAPEIHAALVSQDRSASTAAA